MSQSCASSLAMAARGGSSRSTPQSAARPERQARSRISASISGSRRRSTPSASAYSSIRPSSSASGPCSPARAQRRRQVADGDGADAALGLHRLAGVVDDEGVDDRHGPSSASRKAGFRQRERLAGQPFERAVRAEMHQRVDALLPAQRTRRTRRRRGAAAARCRDSRACDLRARRDPAAARRRRCRRAGMESGRCRRRRPGRPRPAPQASPMAAPTLGGSAGQCA